MSLHLAQSRTLDKGTAQERCIRFNGEQQLDRITVTVLMQDNSRQRRKWHFLFAKRDWSVDGCLTVEDFWEATLSRLALKATQCDACGATVSYSVSGLLVALDELTQYFPILKVEYSNAAVPRGGRPQDYVLLDSKPERVYGYIPVPHGRPRPKREPQKDEKLADVSAYRKQLIKMGANG